MSHSLAAKEEAFQESIKLKNQFRHLDENEADFLDSVLESTREKEAALKKETAEQLDAFRKQREEADRKAALEDDVDDLEGREKQSSAAVDAASEASIQWAVGAKKRKRVKEKEGIKGVKLRRASSSNTTISKIQASLEQGALPEARATEDRTQEEDTTGGVHDIPLSHPEQPTDLHRPENRTAPQTAVEASTVQGLSKEDDVKAQPPHSPQNAFALGLGDYSSDDD